MNGGIVLASGNGPEASRALRVMRLERAGADPALADSSAPALGALSRWLPDFYHRVVLGEVSADEWAAMARQLDHAARLCRAHTGGGAA